MRKEILEKRSQRLREKIEDLKKTALASQSADEVRTINNQLTDLAEDLKETEEELNALSEEERAKKPEVAPVQLNPMASYGQNRQTRADGDVYASMEYRNAFKAYVQTGAPIPANLIKRDANGLGPVTSDDLGATIPTTILKEFIEKVKGVYGQLYTKVRKLNIKGGVKIPISDLSATFKWINESTASPRQSAGEIKQYIEFSYNIGEIRVSQTLLSSIIALDSFENEITKLMVEAYVKEMDYGIIRGTGNGQMLGILNDTRVTGLADHTIAMTAADMANWTKWRKNLFAKLPLGRRAGEFIFPISTVESYLMTMADNNNNPIFKQATGIELNELSTTTSGKFFGREITLVEPDIVPDFDTANTGDVIGIFWTPNDYAINTNQAFGMKRYYDEDRNEWVNKALTIVDGKIVDPYGCYLITKG